jgi:hypothetical protein
VQQATDYSIIVFQWLEDASKAYQRFLRTS